MTADAGPPIGSCAVLIGVSAYEYAEFPPIRAARNSLQAMQSLLAAPTLCGWPPELITVIANPISAADLADRIADLAEDTTGVLLLYYVGHGVLSTRGELCLTVTSTRPNRPKITGLPWETLAEVLRACPARIRLAILDCCFAGRAIEALGADDGEGLADLTHVDGVYTLAATTRNRTAHVPPASQQDTACTSFTGEFQALIRAGIPGKPSQLTFGDIYPELRQRLQAKGLPAPSQRGTDTAHQFPFTANTAARNGSTAHLIQPQGDGNDSREAIPTPEPDRSGQARHARILTNALRAAQAIPDKAKKAAALANIARAVAAADPDRAARLTADAERIAQSILGKAEKAAALANIARAVAAADPDRAARLTADAEEVAQSIADGYVKAWALAAVVRAVAAADPDRAARLTADGERIAQSIPDEDKKASALVLVAEAVAAADADLAERIAQSIPDEDKQDKKAIALSNIAGTVAAADPDRAERIAQSIPNPFHKEWAVAEIARAVAAADPDRAERIAQSIRDGNRKAAALAEIVRAVAGADPDRAARLTADVEEVAQATPDGDRKAAALVLAARAVAAADPDRAARLTADAEEVAQAIPDGYRKSAALAAVAEAVAAADPDRAESIAQSIPDEDRKAAALADIVRAVAAADPGRAAQSISRGYEKAWPRPA
jgi:hypothetical protein